MHLGLLDENKAQAIADAASEVSEGHYADQFPLDVFQTGSGTSSSMNMNEVLAKLASQKAGEAIHPNDHVNMSQSSNDVIPTTVHVSACLLIRQTLLPALSHLETSIKDRAADLSHCLLYTSPSPRDRQKTRMPSSA